METSTSITSKVDSSNDVETDTTTVTLSPMAKRDDTSIFNDKTLDIKIRASAARRIGNDFFLKCRLQESLEAYSQAIQLLSSSSVDDCIDDIHNYNHFERSEKQDADDDDDIGSLLAVCLCNRAAVNLKLKRWSACIEDCTTTLRSNRSSSSTAAKSYFRRAKGKRFA